MAKVSSSKAELARSLKVAAGTVSRYLRRPDSPVKKLPPWNDRDLTRIRAWKRGLQEDRARDGGNDAVSTGIKLERMLLTRAQRKRLEISLVDRSVVEAVLNGLEKLVLDGLDDLERGLAQQLVGLAPPQAERVVRECVRAMRTRLAQHTVIELQPSDQVLEAGTKPAARSRPTSVGIRSA
jgi:hypothetical protein